MEEGVWAVTGDQIRRVVCGKKKSTAGSDDHLPASWALLPSTFFADLADWWNDYVKNRGSLPANFGDLRGVLIPAGEKDPCLQILCLAWRACSTATIRNIKSWITEWVHEDIVNAPLRQAEELTEELYCDLVEALQNDTMMMLAHIDQSKCFYFSLFLSSFL